jgi:hypothetical protein
MQRSNHRLKIHRSLRSIIPKRIIHYWRKSIVRTGIEAFLEKTFAKGLTIPFEGYTLVNALEGSTNDPQRPEPRQINSLKVLHQPRQSNKG